MNRAFDAIVIGAGQAGPSLVGRLTAAGMRVALVERKRVGGTCVNVGCMPTKALVASAYAAHLARRGADFGIAVRGAVEVDMPAVKARKDKVANDARGRLEAWLGGMAGCTLLRGHARFESATEVRVGDEVLSAPRIFINVGARAAMPAMPGIDTVRPLTSTTILALDAVPRHLVVVGGSYIGLEFAQMYRRFGSAVTVIEAAPRLIAREDAEVSAGGQALLEREGIVVHVGAKDLALATEPSQSSGSFREAKARIVTEFEREYVSRLLSACGGNVSEAARVAGKNRRAFWELIRRHNVDVQELRRAAG